MSRPPYPYRLLLCSLGAFLGGNQRPATTSSGEVPSFGLPPPSPRAVGLHRLNALEYDISLRALLASALGAASQFPADPGLEDFHNNAAGMSLSPTVLALYDRAAQDAP